MTDRYFLLSTAGFLNAVALRGAQAERVQSAAEPGRVVLSASDAIAVAASFIALLALGVSIWTVVSDYQHKRLGVRPRLAIHRYFDQRDSCGLTIGNLGLGPAIVTSVEFEVDGKPAASWDHALTQLGFGNEWRDLDRRVFKPDDTIVAQDSGWLLRLDGLVRDYEARREQLQSALERVRIRVRYESLYREKRVHDWP